MFTTLSHVVRHFSFADWKKWHDNTKPIRGRSPEIRPLGARRDGDKFSIRMNDADCVELVLYRTPVIKWYSDERVEINCGRWTSAFTCRFIQHIVPLIYARHSNRQMILEYQQDGMFVKQMMTENQTLVFDYRNGRMVARDSVPQRYTMVLNRKKANNVRAQYKELIKYANAMTSLMKEGPNDKYVHVSPQLFCDNDLVEFVKPVLGEPWREAACPREEAVHMRILQSVREIDDAPEFMELVRKAAEASDDDRIRKYSKIVAWVLAASIVDRYRFAGWTLVGGELVDNTSRVSMAKVNYMLKEFTLKAHARDVLELKPISPDKLSGNRYSKWISDPSVLPIAGSGAQ